MAAAGGRVSGRWAGVPVLVTGAQGFIGSWLAERLLAAGAEVHVPIRDVHPEARYQTDGIRERCNEVAADIVDYHALVRVLNEHDIQAVFHLAAQTQVGTASRSPLSTFEANIRGTYVLLEACRATGVVGDPIKRIVVASSDKAYGRHEQLPYREEFPLQPDYPYDVSKAATDMIARSYATTYGMPVAVTRLANIYGGGDINWARLVPETMRALTAGRPPVLRSDGSPVRDYIYVEDAVGAYLAVAESLDSAELHGRAWNAGAGEAISVRELVDRIIRVTGKDVEPDIRGEGTPAAEIDRQFLDSTAIGEELGWRPQWDLDRGLAATWEWYERRLGSGG